MLTVSNPMLSRQEKLVQLAEKFARKASLRESWLADMSQVLDELDKGQDVHAVDAALKRHEAISADVHAGVSEELCVMMILHSGWLKYDQERMNFAALISSWYDLAKRVTLATICNALDP